MIHFLFTSEYLKIFSKFILQLSPFLSHCFSVVKKDRVSMNVLSILFPARRRIQWRKKRLHRFWLFTQEKEIQNGFEKRGSAQTASMRVTLYYVSLNHIILWKNVSTLDAQKHQHSNHHQNTNASASISYRSCGENSITVVFQEKRDRRRRKLMKMCSPENLYALAYNSNLSRRNYITQ